MARPPVTQAPEPAPPSYPHTPVLIDECIQGLEIKPDGIYIDGTLGRGGHAREILKRLDAGRLIAIDRDCEAIDEAGNSLSEYSGKLTLIHDSFDHISAILDTLGISTVSGMLFDLGVSSPQLDDSRRGFSYMSDAPLDMRMDRREGLTARDIVNTWPKEKLREIFFAFGEERYSGQIAAAIVRKREAAAINTTFELSGLIRSAMPAAAGKERQHPAKRCFQALRIAVNDELTMLAKMLGTAPDRLSPGGRLCIISFHSLEDRIVKNAFSARARGCICPKDFPVCTCGFIPSLRVVTKRPVTASDAEVSNNPRARSGKLRIAERV